MQKIEKALDIAVASMMFSTFGNKEEGMQAIHAAHDELQALKDLLKSIEWINHDDSEYGSWLACPSCEQCQDEVHSPDCKLAKFIPKD
jgi:hypothetical protein